MTPLYPYLTAGVFKIFGIYTAASAIVLLSMQCLFSALNCLPVFYLALNLFDRRVASWSGWAWAFFPYAVYFPAERIWSTWLSTALFSVLFLWTLYLERSARLSRWIGVGLLWGLYGAGGSHRAGSVAFHEWLGLLSYAPAETTLGGASGRECARHGRHREPVVCTQL